MAIEHKFVLIENFDGIKNQNSRNQCYYCIEHKLVQCIKTLSIFVRINFCPFWSGRIETPFLTLRRLHILFLIYLIVLRRDTRSVNGRRHLVYRHPS